jgi:hypothetical protein
LQAFLPLNENAEIVSLPLPENTATLTETTVAPEQLPELLESLASYQDTLKQLSMSGGFEIDELIKIAEQLLQIAEHYHCSLVADWANTLKSQAQLFDITNLARTLKGFEVLLGRLRHNAA